MPRNAARWRTRSASVARIRAPRGRARPLPEAGGGADPAVRHAPATARNGEAILDLLRQTLPPAGVVLEVASGTGEHAVRFARALPGIVWQPSDPDPMACASIAAHAMGAQLANLRPPLALDAAAAWPDIAADAIVCINMIHISPWSATEGLMRHAAALLPRAAPLILYGPYRQAGITTAPSNEAFDAGLRARNPAWGLRSVEAVVACAADTGIVLDRIVAMPTNNLSLILRRG